MDDDLDSSWHEDRRRIVGLVDARVLVVIYTYRGDVIRLISARPANKRETSAYYRGQMPA